MLKVNCGTAESKFCFSARSLRLWAQKLWSVQGCFFSLLSSYRKFIFSTLHIEDEHHHAVHAFISCSWIHNMLIPESITGISCFMFRPKPSQRLPTLHGRALHGFHFHHHVSPGLIPCNYGKNHAVHGTCHGSAWSPCKTQKKVKSWRINKSFSL